MTDAANSISEKVAEIYRTESRRILATLIRLLGDFDSAEEALQNAFAAAIATVPRARCPGRSRRGHATVYREIRARGWYPRVGLKRWTRCGGERGSMLCRRSWPSQLRARQGNLKKHPGWKTTGCG